MRHSLPCALALSIAASVAAFPVLGASVHAEGATSAKLAKAAPSPFAGHWEAELEGDGKLWTFLFDFTVKGDSLGGTFGIAQRDGEAAIQGRAQGNHIHFETFGLWDGRIENGALQLTRGMDGGKVQHLVAHRTGAH